MKNWITFKYLNVYNIGQFKLIIKIDLGNRYLYNFKKKKKFNQFVQDKI